MSNLQVSYDYSSSMSQATDNDIAIIGMSCRVAGANSPSEFWELLASSRNAQSKIIRFNSEGFYHQAGGPRKGLTNVNRAYMLDDSVIDKFDNIFFHVPPQEAIAMDPQQRMLMEAAYEAIQSAGIPLDTFTGSDTAVFAGFYTRYIQNRRSLIVRIRDGRLRVSFNCQPRSRCHPSIPSHWHSNLYGSQ